MRVEVVLVDAQGARRQALELPANATVADAVAASRFRRQRPAAVGVHGQIVPVERRLREGDRVDLLRPLLVDPQEARRQRARAPAGG